MLLLKVVLCKPYDFSYKISILLDFAVKFSQNNRFLSPKMINFVENVHWQRQVVI